MSNRKTMLIADDSPVIRGLLCNIFLDEFDIIQAADGFEAIRLLKAHADKIDVAIIDLYMSKMGGFEVLSIMNVDGALSSIPVIISSESKDAISEARAFELGAVDFVIKPFDKKVMIARVAGALLKTNALISNDKSMRYTVRERIQCVLDNFDGAVGLFKFDKTKMEAIYLSESYYQLFDCSGALERKSCRNLFKYIEPDAAMFLLSKFTTSLKSGKPVFTEYNVKTPKNNEKLICTYACALPYPGYEQPVFFCLFLDITEFHKSSDDQMSSYAIYDSLTGIYNRTKFLDVVQERVKNNPNEKYALIRINIDRFKVINEVFGGEIGDEILRGISNALRAVTYGYAVFGRLESDHFVVFFSKSDIEILKVVTDLSERVQNHFPDYNVKLSFGIYEVEDNSITSEQMCDRANMALGTIKGSYLKTYAFYSESMMKAIVDEEKIVSEMVEALEQKQFGIVLQPILDSANYEVVSAEALVRWFHPTKGVIMPGRFIPIFEKNGFIMKLDYCVWECACILLDRWKKEGRKLIPISVNVSRINMFNPLLCEQIFELVKKYDVSPQYLKLEITESAYTDDPQQLQQVISRLREAGFIILMDDFGSGYSSLNMLKDIPVDVLKIDSRFLENFDAGTRSSRILTSVVRMAGWLDMPVVAEGIETQAQAEFMKSIGCDMMQGYLFSPPLAIEKFEAFADSHASAHGMQRQLDYSQIDFDMLFDSDSHSVRFFNNIIGAMGLYEIVDDRIEIIRVNNDYYELFGYRPEDFGNSIRNVLNVVEPIDRAPLLAACRKAAENNIVTSHTMLRKHKSGRKMWIEAKIRSMGGDRRNPILYSAMFDVTEKKKLEDRLFAESYRSEKGDFYDEMLIANLSDGTYHRADNGETQFDGIDEFYSYTDMVSFIANNYVLENQRESFWQFMSPQAVRDALAYADAVYSASFQMNVDDTNDWSRFEIRRDMQSGLYIIGIRKSIDIVGTGESLQNLYDAMQNVDSDTVDELNRLPIGVGIYEVDGNGLRQVYVNDAILKIYGYTAEQYDAEVKNNPIVVIDPAEVPGYFDKIRKSVGSDRLLEQILKARRRNGETIWVRITAKAEFTADGKIFGYSVQTDVTEEIKLQYRSRSRAEHFKILLEDSDTILFDYDVETGVMYYSLPDGKGGRITMDVPDYLNYLHSSTIMHFEHHDILPNMFKEAIEGHVNGDYDLRIDFYGKGFVWYRAHYVSMRDENGKTFKIIGRLYNIDESKKAEMRLLEENEYRKAIAANSLMVFDVNLSDNESTLIHMDDSFGSQFYPYENYVDIKNNLDMIHHDDAALTEYLLSYENLFDCYAQGETEFTCRYRIKTINNEWVWVECANHLYKHHITGNLRRVSYITLIDEQMRKNNDLRRRAEYDALSGVLNRATAEEFIKRELDTAGSYAFMLFDIDNFKMINDKCGHMKGDEVIRGIGQLLRKSFRESDVVGRLGGDEFIILLNGGVSEQDISAKLNKIFSQLSTISDAIGLESAVTVSAGIAIAPRDGTNFDTLYSCADRALYLSKSSGKNKLTFYTQIITGTD